MHSASSIDNFRFPEEDESDAREASFTLAVLDPIVQRLLVSEKSNGSKETPAISTLQLHSGQIWLMPNGIVDRHLCYTRNKRKTTTTE